MTGGCQLNLLLDGLVHDLGDLDLGDDGLGGLDSDSGGSGVGQTIGVGVSQTSVAKTSVGQTGISEDGGWTQ